MMSINFNENQKQAITHGDGPMMVLAGPGSGKTMVITHRVKWLIEEAGIDPAHILVITFTRAAAEEMKKRFQGFPGMEKQPVFFGTFHSVFFMMLRYAYGYTAGNIIREDTRRSYIRSGIGALELEIEDEKDFINGVLGEISYIKGEMIDLSLYHSTNTSDEIFGKLYEFYEKSIRAEGLIDFDDMLVFTYELLHARKDILAGWQNRYRYILIDEFQDINRVQYEIVKMLAGEDKNIFIVGDDDQSIYRFRGAKPEIMLGFEKDFPGAKRVTLDINYRCVPSIVEMAGQLIRHNKKRFEKNLQAYKKEDQEIVFRTFHHVPEECDTIIRGLKFYQEKGIPYEEMAVIYRTNTQPRLLAGRLMEQNIPFKMRDALPNLFDHFIAVDLAAYLRLAMGERDRKLFLRVMNHPKRYIKREMLADRLVDFKELRRAAYGKRWLYEKIERFEKDLYLIRNMTPYDAIDYLRKGVGYDDFLTEYAGFRRMDPDDLYEVCDQIQESARDFASHEQWFAHIKEYTQELKRQMEESREERKGVTLTTMHSAKGLEYEVVFLMDINETVTPHKKAIKDADLEEERRLFYVALTRAKTRLFVYSVSELYQKPAKPSRYLAEMGEVHEETGPTSGNKRRKR